MATPIINSITAAPSSIPPKGVFVVTVTATDPDSRTWSLTGSVSDTAGPPVTGSITVTVADPLTYTLTAPTGSGFVITPRAGQLGVFDCVAP